MTYYITQEYYHLQLRSASREAEIIMLTAEKSIQQTVDVSHLVALQASMSINDMGEIENFDSIARVLREKHPVISIIQMVPDGIITHCYPLEGNESIIGYDILADSAVNKEALRAIERREMYFAGPLELRQGGMAVIGRIPVFRQKEFWGFSAVIIMLNDLLNNASVLAEEFDKYRLEFSKVNPYTGTEEYFLGEEKFKNEVVFQSTFMLAGEWSIYLYADNTRNALNMAIPVGLTGLFASVLFSMAFGITLHRAKQRYKGVVVTAENKIYSFLNRISDGFVSLDSDWKYTYANENAGKSSGMTSKDLVGNNIWELFPHLVGQPIYKAFYEAKEAQKFTYFEDYYEPFDIHFEHFIYPSEDGLSVFFRDVTEKKRHEREIYLAEQRLSNHLNQSPLAVIEWDKDFRVVQWSKKAQEIFGWAEKETIGMTIEDMELIYHEDTEIINEIQKDLKQRKTGNQSLNKNKTKFGKSIHCQWYNSVIIGDDDNILSIMSLVQDVTASQKAKIELREMTRLLETTQSLADIGSWKYNPDSKEIFWSNEMYKIHEVTEDFVPTLQSISSFYGTEYVNFVGSIFQQAEQKGTTTFETKIKTIKNNFKWIRVHIEVFNDANSKIYLGSLQDIDELKQAEYQETLRHRKKLEEQKILFELSKLEDGLSFNIKVEHILKQASSIMECERLSLWKLNEKNDCLNALSLYIKSEDKFTNPPSLQKNDFPEYFKSIINLKNDGLIVANDAHMHEATREFSEIYLKPNEITSMLDIPIHRGGKCIGVLCHEHVETSRTWGIEEISFAKSIADIISLMLESEQRKQAEESIRLSEARYKALIKSSNTGAWEFSLGQNDFWCSEEYFTMLGYKEKDFEVNGDVLSPWLTLLHPDDKNEGELKFKEYVENPEGSYENVFRMLHADGNYRWIWSRGYYLRGESDSSKGRIVGAHIDITERKQFEEELKTINDRLRKLSAHLQSVREEERTHIAREIHDELGNQLTGLKLDLSRLRFEIGELDESNNDLIQKTDGMIAKVVSTITAVRKISTDLRPSTLDDLGLIATIEWQAQQFEQRTGIKCDLKLKKLSANLSKDANTTVFRIFQESLTNVMRHAQATKVMVKLYETDDTLVMQMTDNGIGISDKRKFNPSSLGLLGMTERAAMLDGSFNIENESGNGTTVTLSIPLNSNDVVISK